MKDERFEAQGESHERELEELRSKLAALESRAASAMLAADSR